MSGVEVALIGLITTLITTIGGLMAAIIRGNIVARRVFDEVLQYHKDAADKAEAEAGVLREQNADLIASVKGWNGMVDELRAAAKEVRDAHRH